MKGSVLVLLGCSALFFAAPSHSYSVKFISEEDQVANRQDTQSGSPSPDVVTARDAGGNETIETGGNTKPGNESVSEDAQTVKSNVRKRDTRSLVRDMIGNVKDSITKPVTPQVAMYILKQVGNYSGRCFKRLLKFIEEFESTNEPYEIRGNEQLTRSDMIRWLKTIEYNMSACLEQLVGHMTGAEPAYDDDDSPMSVIPRSESDTFMVSELLAWITEIGTALRKCFYEVITILEGKSQGPTDTVQRSSETISDLFEELIEMLSQLVGGASATEKPDQSVPPYQPGIIPYKKRNYLGKRRGYRQYTNLPLVLEHPPHVGYTKEIRNLMLPQFQGFRDEGEQFPDNPGITTLPDDVTAIPTWTSSLLDTVLDIIYSRMQGKVPPIGNIDAAPVEGLRGNGVPGLYRGHSKRQSLLMKNLALSDPYLSQCMKECINKRRQ